MTRHTHDEKILVPELTSLLLKSNTLVKDYNKFLEEIKK